MTSFRRFTISQLAVAADVPASTIRYYERIGLVEPKGRSAGNYRLYSRVSLDRLKFIKAAQAIGFTLDDTRALLADESGSPPSCGAVQGLLKDRLADVEPAHLFRNVPSKPNVTPLCWRRFTSCQKSMFHE